jgi:hypothetical protein
VKPGTRNGHIGFAAAVSATPVTDAGGIAGVAMGIGDSSASTETLEQADLAVRLVAADGDTIWSTTQESKGARCKGAGADVADKIVKQLLRDLEKAGTKPGSKIVGASPSWHAGIRGNKHRPPRVSGFLIESAVSAGDHCEDSPIPLECPIHWTLAGEDLPCSNNIRWGKL